MRGRKWDFFAFALTGESKSLPVTGTTKDVNAGNANTKAASGKAEQPAEQPLVTIRLW